MKIGVTGDTHASLPALRKILSVTPPVDLWLHTGDHAEDALLLQKLSGIRTVAVRGNCDIVANGAKLDEFLVLEDYKLWLTHGHKYIRWNAQADLAYWARALDQDIVIFGHTHTPLCVFAGGGNDDAGNAARGGALLLNPGSPSRPRGGSRPGFAVLDLKKECAPEAEFFQLA